MERNAIAIGFAICVPLLSEQPVHQPLRIADGLAILASCIWIASGMFKYAAMQRTSRRLMGQREENRESKALWSEIK